jgi:Ni/Co efflux regulator RcnB
MAFSSSTIRALAFAAAAALGAGNALAQPADKGGGKGGGKSEGREASRGQDTHPGKGASMDRGGKGHADSADHRGGKGHGASADRAGKGSSARPVRIEHFGDPHRVYVRDYYDSQFRTGKCPPGLAKKNNGCMPPGQAKKWDVGRTLPQDVRYYEVPRPLVLQLGQPPAGYRYVRVADDILLLATGTRMVVDAIRGLGRS